MKRAAFWLAFGLFAVGYWYFAQLAGAVPYIILGDCYATPNPPLCETQSEWIRAAAFAVAGTIYSFILLAAARWIRRTGWR